MSIVNVSVCKDYGMISTDTLAVFTSSEHLKALTGNEKVQGTGQKPKLPEQCKRCSKIIAVPHLQAISASFGTETLIGAVSIILCTHACDDIADYEDMLRPKLIEAVGRLSGIEVCISTLIGWSEKKQRVMGLSFSHVDGFKAYEITVPSSHPTPSLEDENMPLIHALHANIEHNHQNGEALHRALCENQYRSYNAGHYPSWFHCNDEIHLAYVSKHEIVLKTLSK